MPVPDAVSVCGKNPNWATDAEKYYTFGGELKISDKQYCEVQDRCIAVFKKSLETSKFMVKNNSHYLKLQDRHRIIQKEKLARREYFL